MTPETLLRLCSFTYFDLPEIYCRRLARGEKVPLREAARALERMRALGALSCGAYLERAQETLCALANAPLPTNVTCAGMVTSLTEEHPAKVSFAMALMLSGMMISVSEEQFLKTLYAMSPAISSNGKEVREVHPSNMENSLISIFSLPVTAKSVRLPQ